MQAVINNLLLHYQILGSKNKNTILILHGWGHNSNLWLNIAQPLSSKYKVILLDLPGFGSSSIPPANFGISEYTQTVKDFIKKLNLKDIFLIGHSLGGKIAIPLSAQTNSIKKLFLISPSGIEKKTLIISTKIIVFKTLKNLFFFSPNSIRKWLFNKFASSDYRNASPQMRPIFKKIINQDVSNFASKIKIPTFVLWGDQDKEVPVKYAKKLHCLIPNSTIRIIWKTGHSPHLENPQKLLTLLNDYL